MYECAKAKKSFESGSLLLTSIWIFLSLKAWVEKRTLKANMLENSSEVSGNFVE